MSGIRPTEGIYDYKITKDKEHGEITALHAEHDVGHKEQKEHESALQQETAFSYARKYEPHKTYEMKGMQSPIEDLDVKQAISDMQRDRLLQQYQFFVGSSRSPKNPAVTKEIYPYENFDI